MLARFLRTVWPCLVLLLGCWSLGCRGIATDPDPRGPPDGNSTPADSGSQGPVCRATELLETHCGDGIDNDCNALTDCQDPACDHQACSSVSGFECAGGACIRAGD